MKPTTLILGILVVLGAFTTAAVAAATPEYVVTNDDNCGGNTVTVYKVNNNGTLTVVGSPHPTGGLGGCGGYFAERGTSISQNAKCVFAVDSDSDDIAAFKVSGANLVNVGNFSDPSVNFSTSGGYGGSVALTPNGKYLYGAYSGSRNIGMWSVAASCSLTFGGTYIPNSINDVYNAIAITPDGTGLVVPILDNQQVDLAQIQPNGSLVDKGVVDYSALNTTCSTNGCFPTGVDITLSGLAIFGDANLTNPPLVLTAQIAPGSNGISNPQAWDLTNTCGIANLNVPRLSPAACQTGKGMVYISGGYGANGTPAGVITASLTPDGKLSVKNCTITGEGQDNFNGLIDTLLSTPSGGAAVVAEFFNVISTFRINADGSLKLLHSTTDANARAALSFSVYPTTTVDAPVTNRCH